MNLMQTLKIHDFLLNFFEFYTQTKLRLEYLLRALTLRSLYDL